MDEIDAPEITIGDLGLLLWLDSRLGATSTDAIAFRLHKRIGPGFPDVEGLEVSWALIGACAADARELCDLASERQQVRGSTPSGLVAHNESGRRARFPNFATQIYSVYALTATGRLDAAKALADRADLPAASPTAAGRGSTTPAAAGSSSPTRSTRCTRTRWCR